jgi:hypothetical protein
MTALDRLKKKSVFETTPLDNAVIFSRHGDVEQAAAELSALRAQVEGLESGLAQALSDARNVAQWMDDNHAADDSVGFATAWAEIQSIIRKLGGFEKESA